MPSVGQVGLGSLGAAGASVQRETSDEPEKGVCLSLQKKGKEGKKEKEKKEIKGQGAS